MENSDESPWRYLQTVGQSIELIETLAELDSAGVTELASELDCSKSSVHSHLATLTDAGYLVREDGEYHLSYQFLLLGEYVRNNSLLYRYGQSRADELAEEVGHYVHLFTEELGLGVNIYEARGEEAGDYEYQSLKLQTREPLHVTASGKAILAFLPQDRVDTIIDEHGLASYTENTITDRATLKNELGRIRDDGYAVNDEEEVKGFRAVAAPVFAEGDEILGSISVAGPTAFLEGEVFHEQLPDRVTEAADIIQVRVNMSNEQP